MTKDKKYNSGKFMKIAQNTKYLIVEIVSAALICAVFCCLIFTFINSHKNRIKINEIANSQVLIIELLRDNEILVVDSLVFKVNN